VGYGGYALFPACQFSSRVLWRQVNARPVIRLKLSFCRFVPIMPIMLEATFPSVRHLSYGLLREVHRMIRIALSIYLTLATCAGPAFCCCAPPRLLPLLTGRAKSPIPSTRHSCCCHDAPTSTQQQQLSSEGNSRKPACPKRGCPCQGDGSQRAALPTPHSEATQQTQQHHSLERQVETLLFLHPVAGLSLSRACQLPGDCPPMPFLTAEDILRAMHILRC
jgi:hypothetical protein